MFGIVHIVHSLGLEEMFKPTQKRFFVKEFFFSIELLRM